MQPEKRRKRRRKQRKLPRKPTAAAELWTLAKSAEEKSAAESEKIREAAREEMDSLRSHAEDRLEEAADRIVERIVNG